MFPSLVPSDETIPYQIFHRSSTCEHMSV